MVMHTFDPSTQEVEAGKYGKEAWSTELYTE